MDLFGQKSKDEQFVEVYNDVFSYPTKQDVAKELGMHYRTVTKVANRVRDKGYKLIDRSTLDLEHIMQNPDQYNDILDQEIVSRNVRLAKQKQKQQDMNRIDNKSFRHDARIENAVEEYSKEIRNILIEKNFTGQTKLHGEIQECTQRDIGIVHWSDFHLNECVDLECNKYDWKEASKRLRKHVQRVVHIAKAYGMTKLVVAMGGDILNSDRRLDELLANSGNRAKASVLAVDLISQALLELNEHFNLTVTYVIGNESRIPQDVNWNSEVASDNYDFTIFEMLKLTLDSDGIEFVRPTHPTETVMNVNGQNVLLIHGNGSVKKNNVDTQIQQIKGRYLAQGTRIDFVIFGHIHNAYLSDGFARSGSLVGPNEYSTANLNLESRASQNFYIVHPESGFDAFKIDVHDVDDIEGYEIDERLEAYNTLGVDRKPKQVIHQVVI